MLTQIKIPFAKLTAKAHSLRDGLGLYLTFLAERLVALAHELSASWTSRRLSTSVPGALGLGGRTVSRDDARKLIATGTACGTTWLRP